MTLFEHHTTQILKGKVLIYRLFDIAEEINLITAESVLASESRQRRLQMVRGPRQALVMRNAPVRVHLGQIDLSPSENLSNSLSSTTLEVTATFWDYGVASILFEATIQEGTNWRHLIELSSELNNTDRAAEIDKLARQKNEELTQLIHSALKRPQVHELFEDYVIFYLQEVSGINKGTDLLHKVDIAALVFAESVESLSNRSREELLTHHLQYADNDLIVIDWNSAVVLEPTGQRDIADILEFALTHLLELRYFDDLLDRRLAELYDGIEIQKKQRGLRLGWGNNFARIARETNSRYIEFSEFLERVDNSLKVVGDFYLAVIFRASVRRFRISDWHHSVLRKVNILAKVSELLQGEINVNRGHVLEIIIIVLFLLEIISAILK